MKYKQKQTIKTDALIFTAIIGLLYAGLYIGLEMGPVGFAQNEPVIVKTELPEGKNDVTRELFDPCQLRDVECEGENQTIEGNFSPEAASHPVAKEIYNTAVSSGFAWPDYLVRLAYCESRFNSDSTGDMGIIIKGQPVRSRGVFQISQYYHPDVTDQCAFDVGCSTKWTMNMINKGYQIRWSCDRIVKHQKFTN